MSDCWASDHWAVGRTSRTRCRVVDKVPSLMEEFATLVDTPYQASPRLKEVATNFVCRLYTEDNDVDHVGMRLFSQKTRDMERIPPTSDALEQHLKWSVFQPSVWTTAHMYSMYLYECVYCSSVN